MLTHTIMGVDVADGDRVRLTFDTPWRRSIGGRIPVEGEVEKTVEATANVTRSVIKDHPPLLTLETDDGIRLKVAPAHEFTRVEYNDGLRNRIGLHEDSDITGLVVGKDDDRADSDDVHSFHGYVPVGQNPEIELLDD